MKQQLEKRRLSGWFATHIYPWYHMYPVSMVCHFFCYWLRLVSYTSRLVHFSHSDEGIPRVASFALSHLSYCWNFNDCFRLTKSWCELDHTFSDHQIKRIISNHVNQWFHINHVIIQNHWNSMGNIMWKTQMFSLLFSYRRPLCQVWGCPEGFWEEGDQRFVATQQCPFHRLHHSMNKQVFVAWIG